LKYIHNLDITLGQRLGDPAKLTKYKVKKVAGAMGKPPTTPRAGATVPTTPTKKATPASDSSVEETPPLSLDK